jgi:uncharacterized protein YkwD
MKSSNKIFAFLSAGILFAFILSSGFSKLPVQTNGSPLSGWDKNVLKQANTAAGASYLSDEEKKLIFYTNLCRLNPKLFSQTVLTSYLKNNPDQQVEQSFLDNLKNQLSNTKPGGALAPDEQLSDMVKNFAKKMGEEGKTGHGDFQNRMKTILEKFNRVGENCDYGSAIGLDTFMHLLIDKSDPINLGHRKNLLDMTFTVTGVSEQPHKKYQYCCVMDFAGQPY